MGAKSQTRGFSLNRSKTLQMFIFWNCSPNFCIQVRDSASQGSVLQSWQHCPSAGPACSISWHALHRDAWRLTLAHPTEHNCGNCVRLLCTWRGDAKNGLWVFVMEQFPCPGNCSSSWLGHLHQDTVCGKGQESSSPPCQCDTGESGNRAALSSHPSPSWISPWLLILAIPKHRRFPCAPSPA